MHRVLIAEDNTVLANVMRFNLERAQFSVTVCGTGREAYQQLGLVAFNVLITDYQMPGMNGEELCRLVRTELGLHTLPIVMCSAKGLELDIDKLKQEWGISEVLYKPFSMRQVVGLAESLSTQADKLDAQASESV